MNFIVGGTPRSGKSSLKKIFLEKYGIPGFCTDFLRDALESEVTSFGIRDGMKDSEKSEILWPYFRGILEHRRKWYKDNLLIEGTNFLPKYLSEFKNYPEFKIVFLGFADADLEEKFQNIRKFPSRSGEWTENMSDNKLRDLIKEFVEISRECRSECLNYEIKYFDTSTDFEGVVLQAAEYLIS